MSLVTEDEAKQKLCPLVFGTGVSESNDKCEGAHCMGWRWEIPDPTQRGRAYSRNETVRGYCGYGGKP